jgi:CPA2 family monovalent cation:H+ antiporter-2
VPTLPDLAFAVPHDLQFILDLGVAVALALLGGMVAVRLRQPPIVGYLVAGIIIGPFTPGFVGDTGQIGELAEIGIVLLLFALGVEFSIRELAPVRRVAIPGAIIQILITAIAGAAVGLPLGLDAVGAVVVGAAIAISSTVVVLKVLVERGELDSLHGKSAIGWMVVQDLATIILIAMLEPLAGGGSLAGPVLFALFRTAVFLVLAYVIGTRAVPWLFRTVSRLGSPELFLLSVFATALLAAFLSSAVFGLSLALGAFVAGLIVSESELSHQAAGEITPFRDLFAVLFFVSVGMLLDPAAIVADVPALLALLFVAVIVKSGVSMLLGRLLGMPLRSAILLGATIGQVGEFSFLLAGRGLALGLLDQRAYNLVLGTAVISIVLTPLLVGMAVRVVERIERRRMGIEPPAPGTAAPSRGEQADHPAHADRPAVVVLGAGRVGRVVTRAVRARGFRCIVVDRDQRALDEMATLGAATLFGDAASPSILRRAGLADARLLVIAIGDDRAVASDQPAPQRHREVARTDRGRSPPCAGSDPPRRPGDRGRDRAGACIARADGRVRPRADGHRRRAAAALLRDARRWREPGAAGRRGLTPPARRIGLVAWRGAAWAGGACPGRRAGTDPPPARASTLVRLPAAERVRQRHVRSPPVRPVAERPERRGERDPVPRQRVGGERPDLERLRRLARRPADDPRLEHQHDHRRLEPRVQPHDLARRDE